MKKLFLMGRSEAGKTSLTQALKGEELHYEKTQYTITDDDTIDSPGEYAESKRFSVGLACFSFEADVVGIVQAADEPYNLFSPCLGAFILRPIIGIITKTDSPYANIPMVKQWLINSGCQRIFLVNNVTREGIDELIEYLADDPVPLTLEQANRDYHFQFTPGLYQIFIVKVDCPLSRDSIKVLEEKILHTLCTALRPVCSDMEVCFTGSRAYSCLLYTSDAADEL